MVVPLLSRVTNGIAPGAAIILDALLSRCMSDAGAVSAAP